MTTPPKTSAAPQAGVPNPRRAWPARPLVIVGGACALAGYVVGSWHQRRALEADLASDLFGRDHFDLLDEPLPGPRRDHRPN